MTPAVLIGLVRSLAIYYLKPGNQRAMRRFYSQFIRKDDLCLDIGAHVGNRTAVWNRLGARVVAVEPQASCFRILQFLFGNNKRILLLRAAVGNTTGTAILYVNEANPTISTLRGAGWQERMKALSHSRENWGRQETVAVHTLEELVGRYGLPEFVKLDAEGFEWEILSSLKTPLPHLSFEFISPDFENTRDILAHLNQLGPYSYNFSLRETHRFVLPDYIGSAALLDHLQSLAPQVISGDIYARISI